MERDAGQASATTMVGSCVTGKFTDRATKHFSAAVWCKRRAWSASDPGASVTRGRRTADELARPVGLLLHHAFGLVLIGGDDHPGGSAQMQIPKLMAG
jgi:hypothetical protein